MTVSKIPQHLNVLELMKCLFLHLLKIKSVAIQIKTELLVGSSQSEGNVAVSESAFLFTNVKASVPD